LTWRSRPLFFGAAALVALLDQVTKHIVSTGMPLHSSIPVVDGLFNITYVRNPGAAFGFLATAPVYFRVVFLSPSLSPRYSLFFIICGGTGSTIGSSRLPYLSSWEERWET